MRNVYGKARLTKAIKETAANAGVRLVKVKSPEQAKQIGIHLLVPDQRELEDGLYVAERDLFPAIFIHRFSTWGYQHGYSRKWSK